MSCSGQRDAGLSDSRRFWRARLAALLLGLLLLGTVEAVLRLYPGLRPPPLTLGLAQVEGRELRTVNPAFPQRFFLGVLAPEELTGIRMASRPYVEDSGRDRPLRVVFAGESTVQGYPHPRRLSAAAYAGAMLTDIWPDRQVEVYNLGITAIASFPVARTVDDALAQLKPSLVVVYSGHNELYGVYGSASLRQGGGTSWQKRWHYRLMGTATAKALRRVLEVFAPDSRKGRSLLEVMGATGSIRPRDERRWRAAAVFEESLRDMARSCRRQGTVLVLCTLVSNDTGFAPAAGEASGGETVEALLAQAEVALDSAEPAQLAEVAERLSQARTQGDPDDARLAFAHGQVLAGLGRRQDAAAAFAAARDRDPVPWRAAGHLNAAIRRVAAQEDGVVLADVEAGFRALSPPEGIGWNLMADHLHPTTAGQLLLARVVVEALRQAPEPLRLDEHARGRLPPASAYTRRQGDLPVERVAVAAEMAELFLWPPLSVQNPRAAVRWRSQADSLRGLLSEAERQGFEAWWAAPDDRSLALRVGGWLFEAGQYAEAAAHYRAARLEEPYTIYGDLWAGLRWARCVQLLRGDLDEDARSTLRELEERAAFLRLAPEFKETFGHFFDGYCAHLRGDCTAALAHMEAAAADRGIQRDFTFDLLAILTDALVHAGRSGEAADYVGQVAANTGKRQMGEYFLRALQVSP